MLGIDISQTRIVSQNALSWWEQGDFSNNLFSGADDFILDFTKSRFVKGNSEITNPVSSTHSSDILALNSSGVYETFAPNVPPITDLGLLVQPSRTNLFLHSNAFTNIVWIKNKITAAGSSAIAPDGSQNTFIIRPDAGSSAFKEIGQNVVVTNGDNISVSYYVKSFGETHVQIIGPGGVYGGFYVNFDIVAGIITANVQGNSTSAATAEIEGLNNGWFRISVTKQVEATSSVGRLALNFINGANAPRGSSVTNDGNSGIYIWQGQFEEGSFATSPVITTGSAVTRQGNLEVISGLNLPAGLEFYMITDLQNITTDWRKLTFFTSNGSANSVVAGYGTGNRYEFASVPTVNQQFGTRIKGVVNIVGSVGSNYAMGYFDGSPSSTDISVTYPPLDRLFLGTNHVGSEANFLRVKEIGWRNIMPNATSHAQMVLLANARKVSHV